MCVRFLRVNVAFNGSQLKRRFFRLGPDYGNHSSGKHFLYYYGHFVDSLVRPKGAIQLTGSAIVEESPTSFSIQAADRTFVLYARTPDEAAQWRDVLSIVAALPPNSQLPTLEFHVQNKERVWEWDGHKWVRNSDNKAQAEEPKKKQEKTLQRILTSSSSALQAASAPSSSIKSSSSKSSTTKVYIL